MIVTDRPELIGPWVCDRAGGKWIAGRGTAIGLMHGEEIIAGVLYEDWNGANINMHVAAIPGRKWLNREFLRICFDYPFNQVGAKRVTGIVPSCNADAMRFDLHLGFVHEATLKDAHPQGDLNILVMRREQCRWLEI
ncbi:MAG TPA: hypothetical protein VIU93_10415 [Gallionellaceae bacterium]